MYVLVVGTRILIYLIAGFCYALVLTAAIRLMDLWNYEHSINQLSRAIKKLSSKLGVSSDEFNDEENAK